MIEFDHPFKGREALERATRSPERKMVTLRWNEKDILDVFASQFREGADVQFMDFPANPVWQRALSVVMADKVFAGSKSIGVSSGRVFSHYDKAMLSLALVDVASSKLGTEIEVPWGDASARQKRIRAIVSRYPYLDIPFNRDIDVKALPVANGAS